MKLISFFGLVATIATAITAQVTAINPKFGAWAMLIGALAASTGGALSKYLAAGPVATGLGIIVAVSGVLAMATGVIPAGYAQIIAVIGTAAAAAGKSLFGWTDSGDPGDGGGVVPNSTFLALAVLVGTLPLMAVKCSKPADAQRTIIAGTYDAQLAIDASAKTSLAFNTRGRLSLAKHQAIIKKLRGVSTAFNEFGGEVEQWPTIDAASKPVLLDAASRLIEKVGAIANDGDLVALDADTQSQVRRGVFIAVTLANGIKVAIASAPTGTKTRAALIDENTARLVHARSTRDFTDQDALLTQDIITIWSDFLVKIKTQSGQPIETLRAWRDNLYTTLQAFFTAQLARS